MKPALGIMNEAAYTQGRDLEKQIVKKSLPFIEFEDSSPHSEVLDESSPHSPTIFIKVTFFYSIIYA
jgi:hypothetical protein